MTTTKTAQNEYKKTSQKIKDKKKLETHIYRENAGRIQRHKD